MSGYGYHWSKCSGGGGEGAGVLIAAVAVAAFAVPAIEIVLSAIWWLIAGTVAGVVVSLAAVVLLTRPLRRWEREAAAELERTRPARLAAVNGRAAPQVTATVLPSAIESHVHYHVHVGGQEAAPAAIRAVVAGGRYGPLDRPASPPIIPTGRTEPWPTSARPAGVSTPASATPGPSRNASWTPTARPQRRRRRQSAPGARRTASAGER